MVAGNHGVVFVFDVRAFWLVSDRQAHLGLTGSSSLLASFEVAPIFPATHDQAGVVHQMAVEVIWIVAVRDDRLVTDAFPRSVGRIRNRDADFRVWIERSFVVSRCPCVEQPVAPLGNKNVGSEYARAVPTARFAFGKGYSLFGPCMTIGRSRVPHGRIVAGRDLAF